MKFVGGCFRFRLVRGSVLGLGYAEELARAVWIVNLGGAGCWILAIRLRGSRLCEWRRLVVVKVRALGCTPLGSWNGGRTRLRAFLWATAGRTEPLQALLLDQGQSEAAHLKAPLKLIQSHQVPKPLLHEFLDSWWASAARPSETHRKPEVTYHLRQRQGLGWPGESLS